MSVVVFLDLETGGLEPSEHQILELQARVMREFPREDARFGVKVKPEGPGGEFLCGPWALEQHTKSGLLDECRNTHFSEELLDFTFAEFLSSQLVDGEKATLAGNSVHFDYGFIRERLPNSFKFFNYRLLDVSAAVTAANFLLGRPLTEGFPDKSKAAHRAGDDLDATLELLKRLRLQLHAGG